MGNIIHVTSTAHVSIVEVRNAPHNFLDKALLSDLADALDALDASTTCRAIVLATEGKSFSAGADFSAIPKDGVANESKMIYAQAMRIFRFTKPIVAAIQGPAIGAGAGLALSADFRIGCPEARFSMSFNRLGFHPGFGLSYTLPRLVGQQKAALLFYTGRRIKADLAYEWGLLDEIVPQEDVRETALRLAQEIAASAPAAVQTTRATLRGNLADQVVAANQHELALQSRQFNTVDFKEGVAAMSERRLPMFTGR